MKPSLPRPGICPPTSSSKKGYTSGAAADAIAEAVADHVVARAREIWEALGGGAAEGSGPLGDRGFPPAGAAFPKGGPE